MRSSASAASSSATRSETAVSASGPKASTPWPPSRTACVPGRAPISSAAALAERATGTSSAWPRSGSGSYRTGSGRPARANASRCGECVWITAPACGLTRYTSVCSGHDLRAHPGRVALGHGSVEADHGQVIGHEVAGRVQRGDEHGVRPDPGREVSVPGVRQHPGAHQAHRDVHHGAAERKV